MSNYNETGDRMVSYINGRVERKERKRNDYYDKFWTCPFCGISVVGIMGHIAFKHTEEFTKIANEIINETKDETKKEVLKIVFYNYRSYRG